MHSNIKKSYYYQADANSLGGAIEQPFHKIIPSRAATSLPAVGGFVDARTQEFHFAELVSYSSAYVRVSGRRVDEDGSFSTLVTAVVEGLNILEVVTAERVVAQISVDHPIDGGHRRISLAGSHFDGLKIGGRHANPWLHAGLLLPPHGADASRSRLTYADFRQIGHAQADGLIRTIQSDPRDDSRWAKYRFGWMASDQKLGEHEWVLCSLVDGVDQSIPGRSFGHALEIAGFGRIFLGELLVSPAAIHLTMVRAELGCNVQGSVSAGKVHTNGHTVPPT